MKRRWVLPLIASFALAGCDDDISEETIPPDPGSVLWENEWSYEGTFVRLKEKNAVTSSTTVPFPTDFEILTQIRYGDDAPPTGDVLDGARVVFEIDGRVLIQPDGFEGLEYYGTDYRVVEEGQLRASVRKSIWARYDYQLDEVTETLLITSADEGAAAALMNFIFDAIQGTIFSGALDSAAARITDALFSDPRVEEAVDQFLFNLFNGLIEEIPVASPEDVTDWIILQLRDSGLAPPNIPDRVLEQAIQPIVEQLLPVDREGLTQRLVDAIRDSDVLGTVLTPERVERVLKFVLYRRMIDLGQRVEAIDRVEILLGRASPAEVVE